MFLASCAVGSDFIHPSRTQRRLVERRRAADGEDPQRRHGRGSANFGSGTVQAGQLWNRNEQANAHAKRLFVTVAERRIFTSQAWSVRPCVRPHMMVSPSTADVGNP